MPSRILKAGVLVASLLFVVALGGCLDASEDAWPDTDQVEWSERNQTCYHDGVRVVFDEGSSYGECWELANAVVNDTLTVTSLGDDVPKGLIVCEQECTCTPSGCTCGPIECKVE